MASPPHYASLSVLELVAIRLREEKGDGSWAAYEALRERDREEVFEAVVQLLRSSSAREREMGADLLIQATGYDAEARRERGARSADVLLAALPTEQDPSVLRQMGNTLAFLEDARAVPALRPLKDHPDARVRIGVASGMSPHQDAVALQTLIELSRDGHASVREEAISALSLKDEDTVDTPELRDAFLDRVSDEVTDIRTDALVGLARRKDPRVRAPLRRELERRPVAIEAIEAVRYLEDASFLPLLLAVREAARPMDEAFEGAIDFAIECLGGRAT
jgi:HEAT repeat protein